jgi:phosphoglucosamine mutase
MARLFGTDGVRGVAGHDLTARLAMDLATVAGGLFTEIRERERARDTAPSGTTPDGAERAGHAGPGAVPGRQPTGELTGRPVAVVGRDPRASGEFLEAAVAAGLAGAGVDVLRLGVLPTPAVAYLTDSLGADLGVVLSASHNPAPDNGIKFFARGGFKLPDAVEDEIEERLKRATSPSTGTLGERPEAGGLLGRHPGMIPSLGFGRITDASGTRERYLQHLVAALRQTAGVERPLAGLRVVVDCAHGAAYDIAPRALRRAGAEVFTIGTEPDGLNINDGCGSTHLEALAAAVAEHGADAGIAHDGDADRCLAISADGEVVDGDQILAVLALDLKEAGRLARDTVVATVMSNLGFRRAMQDAGISVVDTAVGDRYVLEAMRDGGYVLGGEQSGHVILLEHATTGDGVLTALHLLAVVARRGMPLGELAKVMTRFPQVLVNVKGVDKARAGSSPEVATAVAEAEAELGQSGRVLLRPSGTEPAVRVMVEAATEDQARHVAGRLADIVQSALGS